MPTTAAYILPRKIYVLWALVQLVLVLVFGINTQLEAAKYATEANYLLSHHSFSEPKYWFYSVQIVLHVLAQWLHIPQQSIYLVQLGMNLLALHYLYQLWKQFYTSEKATFAALVWIAFLPLQEWTTHLYTESIFVSVVCIWMYYLVQYLTRRQYLKHLALCSIALVFIRPTGMLFLPVAGMAIFWQLPSSRHYFLWAGLPLLLGFYALLATAMRGQGEFDFLLPFKEGHIICGLPTYPTPIAFEGDAQSLTGIVAFIWYYPWEFIRLAGQRLWAFWSIYRSYYSPLHNVVYTGFFVALYVGVFVTWKQALPAFKTIAFCTALVFSVSVMITCDDWHSRFLLPVLPSLFVLLPAGLPKRLGKYVWYIN
jgi:hypothetical protein